MTDAVPLAPLLVSERRVLPFAPPVELEVILARATPPAELPVQVLFVVVMFKS